MIKPIGHRVLVKLLPRYSDSENKLNLVLVDNQKHYQGVRRGLVEFVSEKVGLVKAGEVVVFYGDRGTSFGMDERGTNDGTEWRSLGVSDILAVEEPEPQAVTEVA